MKMAEVVPAGLEIYSRPVGPKNTVCRYRTTQDVRLNPLGVSGITQLTVHNLCKPTLPVYPPAEDRFHWRVLSHLGSGFLNMMSTAEVLRGTLALYNWQEDELNTRRLEAIQHVEHHRLQRFEQGYLLRGLDIEVTVDSNGFTGEGDIHLTMSVSQPVTLTNRPVMGSYATEVNSQVLMRLATTDPDEVQGWLPGGELHTDLMALLHVYLGSRLDVRLQLCVDRSLLPDATMSIHPKAGAVQLGRTAVMRPLNAANIAAHPKTITINLGRYERVQENIHRRETDEDGDYRW